LGCCHSLQPSHQLISHQPAARRGPTRHSQLSILLGSHLTNRSQPGTASFQVSSRGQQRSQTVAITSSGQKPSKLGNAVQASQSQSAVAIISQFIRRQ
jgi:hypothetical protein